MEKEWIAVTGHSGFKGIWLTIFLLESGYNVIGISSKSLAFNQEHYGIFDDLLLAHYKERVKLFDCDVKNLNLLNSILVTTKVSKIIHLAGQPLVSFGQLNPKLTWDTNFNGTHNIIQAAINSNYVESIVIATSDKVYAMPDSPFAVIRHKETDSLGNLDPYGASKAAADLLSQSYGLSAVNATGERINIGVCRAGNVIGGGDLSINRLIPDLYRATFSNKELMLRNPNSLRPWQHVLDSCSGYTHILSYIGKNGSNVFNIGPEKDEEYRVCELIAFWPRPININLATEKFAEQELLALNTDKARDLMGWKPHIKTQEAVEKSFYVYEKMINLSSAFKIMAKQVQDYKSCE